MEKSEGDGQEETTTIRSLISGQEGTTIRSMVARSRQEGTTIRSMVARSPLTEEEPSTPVESMEVPMETQQVPPVSVDDQSISIVAMENVKPPVVVSSEVRASLINESSHKDPNLCVNYGCMNTASFSEQRGPGYCSDECVIGHCK